MNEERNVRAPDAAREAAADTLRDAAVDGRLDFAELDERLKAVYGTKTHGELDALLADLAEPSLGDVPAMVLTPEIGAVKQTGRWEVPRHIVARCKVFSITIDFTEAVCRHREITVDASCGMGKIVMVVPRGWAVDIDAASTNTGHIVNRANHPPDGDAPRLHVIGHAGSGTIRIRHPRWRR